MKYQGNGSREKRKKNTSYYTNEFTQIERINN